jgi:hypothetical protein
MLLYGQWINWTDVANQTGERTLLDYLRLAVEEEPEDMQVGRYVIVLHCYIIMLRCVVSCHVVVLHAASTCTWQWKRSLRTCRWVVTSLCYIVTYLLL